ncbi:MAG: penicillin-binding transpeptidase domain-containing protein, partial [Mycobacterium leprae]
MAQDKTKDKAKRWRLWTLGGIFFLAFAGLVAQLGNLTLLKREQFVQQSEEQQYRSIPVYAPRGVIYDRNMVPLVTNQQMSSLIINYPYYKTPGVLELLASTVKVPLADLQKQVQARLSVSDFYTPIRVKDDISAQEYTRIIELRDQLPGVDILSVPVRLYPYKDSAAHILGYVNQVTAEDLHSLAGQGYLGGDVIGRTGIEATYEQYLRGKNGAERVAVNSRGQPVGVTQTVDPSPGNSLVLTLDQNLQQVAEKTLDWDMWRIRNTIIGDGPYVHAKAGAVVAMDVKTGAILAMASHPAYDLNSFAKGISQAEYEKLMDPILTPEVNRPIQTAYQPGSTWKMLT